MEFSLRNKSARKFGRMKAHLVSELKAVSRLMSLFPGTLSNLCEGGTGLLEKTLGRFPGSFRSLDASFKWKSRPQCGELISAYLIHLVVHVELYSLTAPQ